MKSQFNPFNFKLMKVLCQELQERASHFKVINCFPNNLFRFCFLLSGKHHQEVLFFCFKAPYIRFHLAQCSHFPKDHSHHPLYSHLREAILKEANVIQNDRILELTFLTSQGERRFIGEFFSKHSNYYLLLPDGEILFSLHPCRHSHYQIPTKNPYVPLENAQWTSHLEVEKAYIEMEKELEFNREKQILSSQLMKESKKLQKKEKDTLESLKQCVQWPKIQHEGELIKFHFRSIKKGSSSISVEDWTTGLPVNLTLDPVKTPQEEMTSRFKKAKKLQLGIEPLQLYLEKIQKKMDHIEQLKQQLEPIHSILELSSFKDSSPFFSRQKSKASPSKTAPSSAYREYVSEKGLKILVGKNAKSNDFLTFQIANGSDWWLHAKGYSGSHVIIRLPKNQMLDDETLKDAMQLALHYSKAQKQGEGEVCFTQRKYVSRLGKGKLGLVQISKHQNAMIRYDPVRYKSILERMKET